ncbi:hypothetical protein D9615_009795 [Tricholomella constricta]|uniref:Uncharacterized protein n=1 Tax=Tricholomella constricta TaxID=117010 RepID=A0A8H5GU43_9AGAR|nr:hypothetical protein D9615_009795 [Tricholomella constricta]
MITTSKLPTVTSFPDPDIDDQELPSNITKTVRLSPDLETLDLSLHTYGDPQNEWDVDKFCAGLKGIQYPRLRCLKLRFSADLDLSRLCDISTPSPFRSFLEINHHSITILSLPVPDQFYEWAADDLHLPEDMFPNLREFEGTVYWCSQISKLRYPSSRLRKMKVLIEHPLYREGEEEARGMVYGALDCCTGLEVLNILSGDTVVSAGTLTDLSTHAPGLRALHCFIDHDETAGPVASALASFKQLRVLVINIADFNRNDPTHAESIISHARERSLLLKVQDIDDLREEFWWE